MSFPFTYREIRKMVRKTALHTKMARDILRKSGFRVGSLGVLLTEGPVLTLPPCAPAGLCPRGSPGKDTAVLSDIEQAELWEQVRLAEAEDSTAKVWVRDWLISHDYTFSNPIILDPDASCQVSISLAAGTPFTVTSVSVLGDRSSLGAGIYWHPEDLPYYITKQALEGASQVSLNAVVTSIGGTAPNATLSAVYSTNLLDWTPLATGGSVGVNFSAAGFYASGWETIPDGAKVGEVYIGMSLQAHTSVSTLSFGSTEIKVR